ncbi:hypothetical protein HRbin01_00065 [archaeon HR01]|nr:hypothetical protein HRbin01_00065 [archaeon HR01]
MISIEGLVEKLLAHLKSATGLTARSGWFSEKAGYPQITAITQSISITPLDLAASKALYTASFQIDIWHTSARKRDELVDMIIQYFETNRSIIHQASGWFDLKFEDIRDLEEEAVSRKTLILSFRVVG